MEKFKNKLAFSLLLIILVSGFSLQAQEYSFGIKGGVNYSVEDPTTAKLFVSGPNYFIGSALGFQGGIFFDIRFDNFLVRPEIMYVHSEGEFTIMGTQTTYSINKISIPLLIGYNIWDAFDIYAGPAYQHIIDSKIGYHSGSIKNLQYKIALQFGIKYSLNRIELDLRYGHTPHSGRYQGGINITIPGSTPISAAMDDGRLNQFMLSISYKLFDSDNPWRRKRGCYF